MAPRRPLRAHCPLHRPRLRVHGLERVVQHAGDTLLAIRRVHAPRLRSWTGPARTRARDPGSARLDPPKIPELSLAGRDGRELPCFPLKAKLLELAVVLEEKVQGDRVEEVPYRVPRYPVVARIAEDLLCVEHPKAV